MNSSVYDSFGMQLGPPQIYQLNNMMSPQIAQNYGYYQKMCPYQNIQDFQFIDERKMPQMENWYMNNQSQHKYNVKDSTNINNNETKSENDSPAKSTNEDSKDSPKENNNIEKNEKNDVNLNNNSYKEEYVDLLVTSVNNLLKNGSITMEYINSPTFDPKKLGITLSNLNKLTDDSENTFNKKCENKVCTYIADNPHKLFHSKFFASTSYKSKNLWLCEKCYKAYTSGNYCYYCNTIYREYEYGTQYYDRKKWIQCDYCQKWQHIQCEEKKGKYENIEELSLNPNFKYMCPFCRKDHETFMRQQHKINKIKKSASPLKNSDNNNVINRKRRLSSSADIESTSKTKSKK